MLTSQYLPKEGIDLKI